MNPDTIDRIRKLLNVAACPSASPGEAANAMNLATRLAEKEGLSLGDIKPDHNHAKSPLTHTLVPANSSVACRWAGALIGEAMGTQMLSYHRGRTITHLIFVGLPEQVAISVSAFNFLTSTMERSYRIARSRNPQIKKEDYLQGFLLGVRDNLNTNIQRPGLVLAANDYVHNQLAKDLEVKVTERKSRSRRKKTVDRDSYQSGLSDGKATDCGPARPAPPPAPAIPTAPPSRPPIRRVPSQFL